MASETDSAPDTDVAGDDADQSDAVSGSAADVCAGASPEPGGQELRRLSAKQLTATLEDLFPVAIDVAVPFPEAAVGIFDTSGGNNNVTSTIAFDVFEAAADIASQATADLDLLLGCSASGADAETCVAAFIRDFGARAFRRPLSEGSDGEYEALLDLYRTIQPTEGTPEAVGAVVAAVLQSPQFLYIDNRAQAPEGTGDRAVQFDTHVLASRLSYFLWNSMPDRQLWAAAEQGDLANADGLAREARRMLADPRARLVVRSFHRQWLNLRSPDALQRDPEAFPAFGAPLVEDLYAEVDRFVDHVVWESSGSFRTLMTDSTVFTNDALEVLYGLPASATGRDDWAQASVEQRSGLLSRGAFLVNHAHAVASSPIQRGVFVIRRLLCREIRVPDDVDTSEFDPGPSDGTDTVRDKLAQHRQDPSCAGCHDTIDPIGLAFEHFDAVGGYRTDYSNGAPVDATGRLLSSSEEFEDARELLGQLAADSEVQTCYAQQWLSYAIGRNVGREDRCSIERLRAQVADGNASVQDVLVAITQTDAFRFRHLPELDITEEVPAP